MLFAEIVPWFDAASLSERFPEQWPYFLNSHLSENHSSARWSILFRSSGEFLVVHQGESCDFLRALDERMGPSTIEEEVTFPFTGGWFMYLGYELAGQVESTLCLPHTDDGVPMAFAARCPGAVLFDHRRHEAWLVSEQEAFFRQARAEIDQFLETPPEQTDLNSGANVDINELEWEIEVDAPRRFRDGVLAILDYIQAGDVFQVNLSRGWVARANKAVDELSVFRSLCVANPAPFSGFARLPNGFLVSSSPERLVERRGCKVQTRPIAGTRPRGHDLASDKALIDELKGNLKEQAEHVMLIDLERNDLGRVCVPGSVCVDELMVIESYQHVHHIVSNVIGRLRPSASNGDLIRAVFPGGTITGCPKVRCMEIIAELEGGGRSFYTGSMGYVGHNGQMDLNILIRSVLVQGNRIEFRTGAGIVSDSEPNAELRETEFKALGLLRALGIHWEVTRDH
jgi:anthranilate synthase component 1